MRGMVVGEGFYCTVYKWLTYAFASEIVCHVNLYAITDYVFYGSEVHKDEN